MVWIAMLALGCESGTGDSAAPETEPTCGLLLTYCSADGGTCDACVSEDQTEGWYICTDGWRLDLVGLSTQEASDRLVEHCVD